MMPAFYSQTRFTQILLVCAALLASLVAGPAVVRYGALVLPVMALAGILAFLNVNLWRWLMVAVILLPVSTEIPLMGQSLTGSLEITDACVIILWGLWLAKKLVRRERLFPKDDSVVSLWGLFILAVMIGYVNGTTFHLSSRVLPDMIAHFVKWASYSGLYFLVLDEVDDRRDIRTLVQLVIAASTVGAGIALYQQYAGIGSYMAYYGGLRTSGWFGSVNGFGVFLASVLLLLLVMLSRAHLGGKRAIVYLAAVIVLFGGIVFTYSRAAWLTLAVGSLLIGASSLLRSRNSTTQKRIWPLFLIVSLIALALYALPSVSERIEQTFRQQEWSTISYFDMGGREQGWRRYLQEFSRRPLVGTGYFSYPYLGTVHWSGSHNQWLTMLVDVGLIGVIPFLGIMWQFVRRGLSVARHQVGELRAFASGFLVVLGSIGLATLSGEFLYSTRLMGLIWLLAGLVTVAGNLSQQVSPPRPEIRV